MSDAADGPPTHRPDRRSARRVLRVTEGHASANDDLLVVEEPLEIRAHGPGEEPRLLTTTMRTPGNDADLAVGWLCTEGLAEAAQIVGISQGDPLVFADPDAQVIVRLRSPLSTSVPEAGRLTATTASCGVCGRAVIDALAGRVAFVPATTSPLPWSLLSALPERLRDVQEDFAVTGGLHAAGIFTTGGDLLAIREDVGRHNALDAAIGAVLRRSEQAEDAAVAVLSGRAGFELVAKAAAAGIGIVAAVGAPTELAVRTAERLGLTLVGFLRGGTGNVYTHPTRLAIDDRDHDETLPSVRGH